MGFLKYKLLKIKYNPVNCCLTVSSSAMLKLQGVLRVEEAINSTITLFNLWLPDRFLLLSHLLDVYLTSPPVPMEIEIQWRGINNFARETFQSWPGNHTWLRNFLTPPHPHMALPTCTAWAKMQILTLPSFHPPHRCHKF